MLNQSGGNITLGVLLSQRVKGLSEKNLQVLRSEDVQDRIANVKVEALTTRSYTDAYKVTIPVENISGKLVLRLVNPDEILRENSEATLEEVLSSCASTSFNNRLVADSLFVVELGGEGNKCTYYSKQSNGEREKELGRLIEEQKKVIEEILELEPDNRFAHSELIYVIQRHEEPYANTTEAFGKRLELNERIVKSSDNLAKKNKGLVNRFTYFLNLYKLK